MANEKITFMKNKKGTITLRDIMMMLVVFSVLIVFASIIAYDMAAEYENTDMTNELIGSNVLSTGDYLFGSVNDSVKDMRDTTESSTESSDSLLGSFTSVTGIIQGAATILKAVVLAPVYVANALETLMDSVGIPTRLANYIGTAIMLIIYVIIIFIILSALTRGGTKL